MNANKQDAGGLPVFVSAAIERLLSDAYACGMNGDPFDMLNARRVIDASAHAYDEQCRAASGDDVLCVNDGNPAGWAQIEELRTTAEQNWLFIEHVTNWIIGRGLLEITHEGGSLEAAKNITDSLDRALSRGVPEGE